VCNAAPTAACLTIGAARDHASSYMRGRTSCAAVMHVMTYRHAIGERSSRRIHRRCIEDIACA
jgi:hypothetical protein